ncbi:MAG: antitoxin [Acidobacteriia bacterium]|nr:antitoxin [Terriglobia bacterium]
MALSIKNAKAERLAKELAKELGTTVTGAIIGALEDALRRTRGRKVAPSIREAISEISDRCAALPDIDTRPADEILGYDERGGFR